MATYVLLHGAYQGGWIWNRVTPHLRAAGHTVFTPTLDGCAERRHALRPGIDTESQAAEIVEMLFFEDLHDIVLVGTSCGGMVAARVASSIAAEIGTMKVTEQIDALVTLSTNPMKYLTVPRVLAATLAVPVLVGVGDAIGIFGGYVVGVNRLGFNSAAYLKNTADFLQTWDVGSGMIKGAVFGFIVAVMGCYYGMNSDRGAQGVGRATKSAVVAASVMILASNYLLTELFFTS
ncbi:putative phospholipid ABC transporter permease protein MlaE [mine drainage metagenome]|uniref:Putative phospholipid ABC transporter permease protein MlaE n=1 Tax=mine drainage metagenome TaxID=410659 RepID=A0A1J5PXS8_9ZZZZ